MTLTRPCVATLASLLLAAACGGTPAPQAAGFDAGPRCGNGTLETDELCEGFELRGKSCQSEGFEGGTLRCASNCTLDPSSCYACGDGRVSGPELCDRRADGGFDFGGRTCASELDAGAAQGDLSCQSTCKQISVASCWVPPGRNQSCGITQGCLPGLVCDLVDLSSITFRCQAHCPAASIGTGAGCAAGEQCQDGGVEIEGSALSPPRWVACGPGGACSAGTQCVDAGTALPSYCVKPVGICR